MDPLPGKTIPSVPELANRTPFAVVVNAFLVRAADDGVSHRNRQHAMLLHEFQYLAGDARIGTNVTTFHLPVAHLVHPSILGSHDANGDLCRLAQVRTVERNRRHWPTPHSLAGFLAQAIQEAILHHRRSHLLARSERFVMPFVRRAAGRRNLTRNALRPDPLPSPRTAARSPSGRSIAEHAAACGVDRTSRAPWHFFPRPDADDLCDCSQFISFAGAATGLDLGGSKAVRHAKSINRFLPKRQRPLR